MWRRKREEGQVMGEETRRGVSEVSETDGFFVE